jgi:uncharacterized protein YeeX (DUF496 family)
METSWKIPEIENLLKTRITEQKVDVIINKLTKEFNENLKAQDDRLLQRLFSSFKEC